MGCGGFCISAAERDLCFEEVAVYGERECAALKLCEALGDGKTEPTSLACARSIAAHKALYQLVRRDIERFA